MPDVNVSRVSPEGSDLWIHFEVSEDVSGLVGFLCNHLFVFVLRAMQMKQIWT